ncbi:MAG: hypothetical protein K6F05_04980 [Succinivibrio sp.]|nr:hypothetical protein [Succinivibrio sp.]
MSELKVGSSTQSNPGIEQQEQVKEQNEQLIGEIGHAKSSGWLTFGRVLLGICTVGISEGIIFLVNKITKGIDPQPRLPDEINIGMQLGSLEPQEITSDVFAAHIADPENLPEIIKNILEQTFNEVTAASGKQGEAQAFDLKRCMSQNRRTIGHAMQKYGEGGAKLTEDEFRNCVRFALKLNAVEPYTNKAIERTLSTLQQGPVNPKVIGECQMGLTLRLLEKEFAHIQSADADGLKQIIDQHMDAVKNNYQLRGQMDTLCDEAASKLAENLAEQTGLSSAEVKEYLKTSKFSQKLSLLRQDVETGDITDKDELETKIAELVYNSFDKLSALCSEIDRLNVTNAATKKALYADLFKSKALPLPAMYPLMQEFLDNGKNLTNLMPIVSAQLKEGNVQGIMSTLHTLVTQRVPDFIRQKNSESSVPVLYLEAEDDHTNMRIIFSTLLLDRMPELKNTLMQIKDFRQEAQKYCIAEQSKPFNGNSVADIVAHADGINLIGDIAFLIETEQQRVQPQA